MVFVSYTVCCPDCWIQALIDDLPIRSSCIVYHDEGDNIRLYPMTFEQWRASTDLPGFNLWQIGQNGILIQISVLFAEVSFYRLQELLRIDNRIRSIYPEIRGI